MNIITGILKNSRREANFLHYYMRNEEENRTDYIKRAIASRHVPLLLPYVWVTHHDKYHRKNHYHITDPKNPKETGTMFTSRSESDVLKRKPKHLRYATLKHFIATLHSHRLLPYIHITDHDEKFKSIQYEIHIPSR